MGKRLIFILFIFIIGIKSASALDPACTTTEQNRLKKLASQVYFTYELLKDESGNYISIYDVSASGMLNDFYIYNIDEGIYFEPNGGKIVAGMMDAGNIYELPFYASDTGVCSGFLITKKHLTLPPYNIYSADPLCKGNEEYVLCNPTSSITVNTYEDFERQVKNYIEQKQKTKNEETKVEEYNPSLVEKALDFLEEYYVYISGATVLLSVTGIIIINKTKRKEIL